MSPLIYYERLPADISHEMLQEKERLREFMNRCIPFSLQMIFWFNSEWKLWLLGWKACVIYGLIY